MLSMRKVTKTGLLLVAIAILYFFWILVVTVHEAGYLLDDTDFIFSLVTWAVIGIALYLCIIIILYMLYNSPTKKSPLEFVKKIRESKARQIVLQLPDGLKPEAGKIVEEIEKKTGTRPHVLLGTCYGGCDTPLFLNEKYDLVVHFGHTPFQW